MIAINLPVSEEVIRNLRLGDEVEISGVMVTARDAAHKYLVEQEATEMKEFLKDGMIYHCGPIVTKDQAGWRFVAAGPTTSDREEPYEAEVIARYGVRGIVGKGGMGERTLAACKKYGAVYLHAIGGLAVILARSVKSVRGVYQLEELGVPEAMWVIEVERFPAVVTMDANGNSLHVQLLEQSFEQAKRLMESL